MRTAEEIRQSIKDDFTTITKKTYRDAGAIGCYTNAVSRAMEGAYTEIENAKDPHIYTNLTSTNMDKMGTFVNVPRETNESDTNYLYRMMNWTHLKAAANYTAVNDSLLNLSYASNAQYYPGVYGAGTGIVYVIPKDYSDATISSALEEAKTKIRDVISPESYTEYVVPTAVPVIVVATLESENGDIDYLHTVISAKIQEYIDGIAPNEYLSVGSINNMILDIENVDYFNVNLLYIGGESSAEKRIMQGLETKMLFQEMAWEV